jgi:hypothetical protein
MGFRSKMMTEDMRGIKVPDWFISKHPTLNYGWESYWPVMSLSSRFERKFYDIIKDTELFTDIQKVLVENNFTSTLSVVLLHECGGITLVLINHESIRAREPLTWKEVENVEHDYCYQCSLPPNFPQPLH